MRNFRTLTIWQQGIDLVLKVYEIASQLPTEEKYGLASQICRASVSIPSNIAEGCSRNSDIEYKRFLEVALGSAFELETQLIIIQKLQFASADKLEQTFSLLTIEQKMVNNLISKIKDDNFISQSQRPKANSK
ncbi:MAG: four helix bundle protein [Bacteroidetes bacterium]|nr:MAG: four helix bundle protein [Bacteroidota bacterium]